MDEYKKWQSRLIAEEMTEILRKKSYDAFYAENVAEARSKILQLIPEGASVGLGGSMTIKALDILDMFRQGNYRLIDRYQPMSWEEELGKYREAQHADVFLTGTNAVTRNGELVNVDSSGNRVSAMIFGPQKVIVVTGTNKVVDNIDDAMKRLRHIAPLNVKRLKHKAPCAETGKCEDCSAQPRMCNYTTIIHHGMKFKGRISIIMIAEELGF